MYLSQTNLDELRDKVENKKGFQIALAPMQPLTFPNVKTATDALYKELVDAGFSVLVDDRNKRPKNMFEVIEFLGIRHRVVISERSLSAGVYEYKDLKSDEFEKVAVEYMLQFLKEHVIWPTSNICIIVFPTRRFENSLQALYKFC